MRRKKLSSNLETSSLKKCDIESTLKECGFGELTRAEELSILDFKKLYDILNDKV